MAFRSLLLILLPVIAVADEACTLPDPSNETFTLDHGIVTYYQQFRYPSVELQPLGCLILTQEPGPGANQQTYTGYFSRKPTAPIVGVVTPEGNRLHSNFTGEYGHLLSAETNLVYGELDFVIEHFCLNGLEDMVFVYTFTENPSDEMIQRILEAARSHSEVDVSKFEKVIC